MFACLGATATASPVGKDGLIHACYRVKGKPRGSLRVLPSAKKRCKRGERKVAWSVAGSSGQAGSGGQAGATGQSGGGGQAGADGSAGNEAALQSKIANLNLKVEGLERTLEGITHADLSGVLGKLNGLDNADLKGAVNAVGNLDNAQLLEAVGAAPLVDTLCTQVTSLTGRSDELGSTLGSVVSLVNAVPIIGGALSGVSVPLPLGTFDCTP